MDSASWNSYVRARKQDHCGKRQRFPSACLLSPPGSCSGYNRYSTNWLAVSDATFDTYLPKAMAATSIDGVKQVVRTMGRTMCPPALPHFAGATEPVRALSAVLKGYNGQNFALSGVSTGRDDRLLRRPLLDRQRR